MNNIPQTTVSNIPNPSPLIVTKPPLFAGARRDWKFLLIFVIISIIFWGIECVYQYVVGIPGDLLSALIRGSAIAGGTYISLALFSSIWFKFNPRLARYWYVRRSLGVMGFIFILIHVAVVIVFLYAGQLSLLLYSLNPFENPVLFGLSAFFILFLMAITSFDYAVTVIGQRRWKMLHRLVYIAYMMSIFHFMLLQPALIQSVPGGILYLVTFAVLLGEFYWYIKISARYNFKSIGTIVGAAIIASYLLLGYLAFVVFG